VQFAAYAARQRFVDHLMMLPLLLLKAGVTTLAE